MGVPWVLIQSVEWETQASQGQVLGWRGCCPTETVLGPSLSPNSLGEGSGGWRPAGQPASEGSTPEQLKASGPYKHKQKHVGFRWKTFPSYQTSHTGEHPLLSFLCWGRGLSILPSHVLVFRKHLSAGSRLALQTGNQGVERGALGLILADNFLFLSFSFHICKVGTIAKTHPPVSAQHTVEATDKCVSIPPSCISVRHPRVLFWAWAPAL